MVRVRGVGSQDLKKGTQGIAGLLDGDADTGHRVDWIGEIKRWHVQIDDLSLVVLHFGGFGEVLTGDGEVGGWRVFLPQCVGMAKSITC